ncbi:MAG: ATP-binding protein [Thermoflexales bacterium]
MSWESVIGHTWATQRLRNALARGTLGQSLLFIGPPQVGKTTLALTLAEALLAQDTRGQALIAQRKHPDLLTVEPEGANATISIERVRELQHALQLTPMESRHRVAILADAQALSLGAMNALLKTLEEPASAAVLILTATSADALLPTILSRCQVLPMRPLPRGQIEAGLQARGASPAQAALLAALAQGRVGWALQAWRDAATLQARLQAINDLLRLLGEGLTARFAYAEQLAKAGDAHIRAVLQTWQLVWRDVTRAAIGCVVRAGAHSYGETVRRVAEGVSPETAAACLQRMVQTEVFITQNANARLALDVLLITLPRLSYVVEPLSFNASESEGHRSAITVPAGGK